MLAIVFGLVLAEHKVFDAIVGSDAVDVVNDLTTPEWSADVLFHDEAMHGSNLALSVDNKVTAAQRASAATPGRMVGTKDGALFLELARFGATRGIRPELAGGSGYGLSTHRTWFCDLGHVRSIAQLQGV
jgi:hypothetical protein